MKKILLVTKFDNIFDKNQIMAYTALALRDRLNQLGYSLEIAKDQNLNDVCQVWFSDVEAAFPEYQLPIYKRSFKKKYTHTRNFFKEACELKIRDKCILFLYEPWVVKPENKNRKILAKFNKIICWDSEVLKLSQARYMRWIPYRIQHSVHALEFDKRKLLVNISGNKYSDQCGELYSKRRKLIRLAEKIIPDNFDLYGIGWNKPATFWQKRFPFLTPRYSSYRGMIGMEGDVLGQYKFRLVYENTHVCMNWITEKIWDTFQCGCVPVYWGAKNIEDYVPVAAFVDRRKFKSDEELLLFIKTLTKIDFDNYLREARKFMDSPAFDQWSVASYVESILKATELSSNQLCY